MLRRLCFEILNRVDYLLTLARLTIADWLAGPPPETPTDRAIREEGERIRKAFPKSISIIRSQSTAMMPDLDIWRAAQFLVRKHGANAELEAARLKDRMLDRGDDEARMGADNASDRCATDAAPWQPH